MSEIRVMHLIHHLGTGGAENGIINLANSMDASAFRIAICPFVPNGRQSARLNNGAARLVELDKRAGNDVGIVVKLWKLFRKWQPHIVHTHAWGTLCEGIASAKLARVPIIVHGEHGTIQRKPINILVQRAIWRATSRVLSVSEAHRRELCKSIRFPLQKISVVQNGVDTDRFRACDVGLTIRDSLGIRRGEIVIATVGRLVPVKDHEMLLEGFAILEERCPSIRLLVAGDGPLKDHLLRRAGSLQLSSKLSFLGARADVPEILRAADIFVLTSKSEGMSNTILEAMSTALPIVATNVGGNSEMVVEGVTGLMVQSGNARGLADALEILVNDPIRRAEMGRAGREVVEKQFSLQRMVEKYENLYIRLYRQYVGGMAEAKSN